MFGVKSRQISQKYRLSVPITLEKGLSSLPVFLLCTMKLLVSSFHNLGKERSKNLQSLWLKDTFFSVQVSEVAQSCPTLCDPMDCILPGSSIDGIFQAKILEWVAISFSRRSSWPRDWTQVSHIVGRRSPVWGTREYKDEEEHQKSVFLKVVVLVQKLLYNGFDETVFLLSVPTMLVSLALVLLQDQYACSGTQSCPPLRDPMDCSPPGSSVCRIFHARILEQVHA